MSNLYPKAHSCVAVYQMTDGISFTSQVHNTETRSLVWEKGKPYVVVLLVRNILQTCIAALSILWVVSMEMKDNNIIFFRVHRFFSSRKILLMRIFGLILDFGKETHLNFSCHFQGSNWCIFQENQYTTLSTSNNR